MYKIERMPRNDPPQGPEYNPYNMLRFIQNYRTVARGFYDAMYLKSKEAMLWLCPKCDEVNHESRVREDGAKVCSHCATRFESMEQILLGVLPVMRRTIFHDDSIEEEISNGVRILDPDPPANEMVHSSGVVRLKPAPQEEDKS